VSGRVNIRALVRTQDQGARIKGRKDQRGRKRSPFLVLTVVSIDAHLSSGRHGRTEALSDMADAGSLATVTFHN
jgi:hypothetical protein